LKPGPLEIGLWQPLQIREERLSEHPNACRVLYVSDIHLRQRRSRNLALQIIASVQQSAPDVVLLGGDLVDRATELDALSELVGSLADISPVLAVGGNHDQHVGLNLVRDAIVSGGGKWIHSASEALTHDGRTIRIFGPEATAEVTAVAHVRILCGHNPRIWKSARRSGYDLILAGHLHGCQFVAFEFRDRLYPGAIFYPYCYLTHRCDSTTLVVSRGVSDLIPVRWRCPREVVLCFV
jgi:uncharacterized protein